MVVKASSALGGRQMIYIEMEKINSRGVGSSLVSGDRKTILSWVVEKKTFHRLGGRQTISAELVESFIGKDFKEHENFFQVKQSDYQLWLSPG